jgi:hypothetical protein
MHEYLLDFKMDICNKFKKIKLFIQILISLCLQFYTDCINIVRLDEYSQTTRL